MTLWFDLFGNPDDPYEVLIDILIEYGRELDRTGEGATWDHLYEISDEVCPDPHVPDGTDYKALTSEAWRRGGWG